MPNSVICCKHGGPSGNAFSSLPIVKSANSLGVSRDVEAKSKNSSKVRLSALSSRAYRVVYSEFWYGKFIHEPKSPRSAFTVSCLGNSSHEPKPNADAISASLSRISAAGINSVMNRYKWAPPDLLRHMTKGSSSRDRCSLISSIVSGVRTVMLLAFVLPLRCASSTVVWPCADWQPLNSSKNLFSIKITPANGGFPIN